MLCGFSLCVITFYPPVLRIVVDNRADRDHLLRKWPKKAFKCNQVNTVAGPIGFNLNILGYSNDEITEAEHTFLKEKHGLVEAQKIPKSNKITCKPLSIDDMIKAINGKVMVSLGAKTCIPQVRIPVVCETCGEPRYHKNCEKTRCTNCSSIKHRVDDCKSDTLHCLSWYPRIEEPRLPRIHRKIITGQSDTGFGTIWRKCNIKKN